ncbi:thiol reductant ABC exporter subunit CydC [Aquibacillus koreensis]|uniref:Thiol reductant ABC exporter subunit CydC n=1 Tax=Aquibacillus koreensis TaxID=279446 RepID=A0A9X3WJY4_9BACI|nr:thiol reductant ABC exporter subunit CydC [Aquibacillus koreensis]MCT2534699.1 thiol reductant ABC exporter subunit CydC [Aquibacillus koreensis]MDC3419691.1 thiol reductant ABC exporter subunit CydC [Aquibacillus koreensis]
MTELKSVIKLMFIERKDMYISVFFGVFAGISTVAVFAISGYIVSKAALLPPLYILTIFVALLKLFTVIRAFSKYAERYYSHKATFTILSNVRTYFFTKLEGLAPSLFQRFRSGDLLARVVGDVESLQHFFLRVIYPPIVMLVVFLTTIIFTTLFSLPVALVLLTGLILTGFCIPLIFAIKQRGIQSNIRQLRAQLSTDTTEFLYGFLDLKLYRKVPLKEKALRRTSDVYIGEQKDRGKQEQLNFAVNHWVSLVTSWSVLALGAYLVSANELDGVFLAMLVLVSLTVFETATPMTEAPSYFEDARNASTRLFSIIDEAENEQERKNKNKVVDLQKAPEIECANVDFYFPGEDRPTLANVSLRLPSGSKTAIVGPSGCGKSALLHLLLKLYSPSSGTITVQGQLLADLDEDQFWENISPVLQSNHFFYGTVRDNLKLAGEHISDKEMNEVLSWVKLDHLSLGATILEKGANLSGGEQQRLAIARAILKKGSLLFLDEPTSSVDPITEQRVMNKLFTQAKGSTVVLISHKLTGLEQMDQIIVMDKGTIIETGTYPELIKRKGYFYQMKQIEKSVFL